MVCLLCNGTVRCMFSSHRLACTQQACMTPNKLVVNKPIWKSKMQWIIPSHTYMYHCTAVMSYWSLHSILCGLARSCTKIILWMKYASHVDMRSPLLLFRREKKEKIRLIQEPPRGKWYSPHNFVGYRLSNHELVLACILFILILKHLQHFW